MSSKTILETMANREADKANRAQPRNRKGSKKRSAQDPGGLHADVRQTATLNESARQVDESNVDDRDNFPSTWKRATALDAPPPRPGMAQRWVRIKSGGVDDTENYDRYYQEGWRARKPSTVSKSHSLTTSRNPAHAEMIVKKGHVLMETTQVLVDQRNAFYKGSLDRQTKAAETELMAEQTGRTKELMPLTDATITSRASLARRRPRVAADQ